MAVDSNVFEFSDFRLFTIEDGLSQTRVNETFLDSRGFLWVCTPDGLNRYDGYGFRIYRHQPFDTFSLSDNTIRCIDEDIEGFLWIGTNKGVNRLDPVTGQVIRYKLSSPSLKDKIPEIAAIYCDKDGNTWCRSANILYCLNPEGTFIKEFIIYPGNDVATESLYQSMIIEDINGILWFGTKEGLFSFDRKALQFRHFYHDPDNSRTISSNDVREVYQDKNGELWVGTVSGLNRYDRIKDSFVRYLSSGNSPQSGQTDVINEIYGHRDGYLWLGTNRGLVLFNKRTGTFSHFHEWKYQSGSISMSAIYSIMSDPSGILWIGGQQGLIKADTKPRKFLLYNSRPGSRIPLSGDMISSVYKDRQDKLWVGIWNNGLDIIPKSRDRIIRFSASEANPARRISSGQVRVIYEDVVGTIWLGTSNGIFIADKNLAGLRPFSDFFDPIQGRRLEELSVFCIKDGFRDDIWVGTNSGLFRFQRKTRLVTHYSKFYHGKDVRNISRVFAVQPTKDGKVWFGTNTGLFLYDLNKDLISDMTYLGPGNELPSQQVNTLHLRENGELWVGTNAGLSRLRADRSKYTTFTEKEGLANNFIYSILEDKFGHLWFSSNKGLSCLNTETLQIRNYTLSDGLQSYEYNFGAACFSYDGEFFFGGIGGLNAFYPDKIPLNPHIPPLHITEIEVIERSGAHTAIPADLTNILNLKHFQNISISFAALDYTNPHANKFRYSMQEGNRPVNWINMGNQHQITFSNLAPGEYILRIIGSNNDEVWNDNPVELRIQVQAPWWKTRYALFFYVILLAGFMIYLLQYWTSSLRKANHELRQKEINAKEVSHQKELLSRRNKNIEDSLIYAQRIQKAMLTSTRQFKSLLPESFILHKPKDIVSGDFYWLSEANGRIFVAAIDCTGHGVPGAFMSLIGFEFFRKIINLQKIYDPGGILNALNANFEDIFGSMQEIKLKDGMDLALCVFDPVKSTLEFAGAVNPLYIIRDGKLIEIKGDRFSVGADSEEGDKVKKVFTGHKIKLLPDDMIYFFTDGFADQFGGPEGKKYKYRRFRHLLLTIHQMPLDKQKQFLEESIADWMGDYEQIDDILVIGIKPVFHA